MTISYRGEITWTIPAAGHTSDAQKCPGRQAPIMLVQEAAAEGAAGGVLRFWGCSTLAGTYLPIYDKDPTVNAPIVAALAMAASPQVDEVRRIPMDPADLAGCQYVKVQVVAADKTTPAAQASGLAITGVLFEV